MKVVEDSASRYVLGVNALRAVGAGVVLIGLGLLLALVSGDVLRLECDRRKDQCRFESIGLLQGGSTEGSVPLSRVQRFRTQSFAQRSSGNRVYNRERHSFVLVDGSEVPLEPRYRGVMFDDLLAQQFEAFRRSSEPSFSASALHFGHIGFMIPFFVSIGLVLLVLAESKSARFDFERGRFSLRARGLRTGKQSLDGDLGQLSVVETVSAGTRAGLYLTLADGRRARLVAGTPDAQLAQSLAARLRLPIRETDSDTIRRAGASTSSLPALGCMLLALAPLAAGGAWWVLDAIWSALL